MTDQLIFRINVISALIVWSLVAWQYMWPAIRGHARADALRALLYLHAFRFVGLSFLVPGVVSNSLPQSFAQPAAWGDLVTAVLALVAIATLRYRAGILVVWVFNIVGLADLVNAFREAYLSHVSSQPGLQGAAYFIPTLLVPLLIVTHVLIFLLLVRSKRTSAR